MSILRTTAQSGAFLKHASARPLCELQIICSSDEDYMLWLDEDCRALNRLIKNGAFEKLVLDGVHISQPSVRHSKPALESIFKFEEKDKASIKLQELVLTFELFKDYDSPGGWDVVAEFIVFSGVKHLTIKDDIYDQPEAKRFWQTLSSSELKSIYFERFSWSFGPCGEFLRKSHVEKVSIEVRQFTDLDCLVEESCVKDLRIDLLYCVHRLEDLFSCLQKLWFLCSWGTVEKLAVTRTPCFKSGRSKMLALIGNCIPGAKISGHDNVFYCEFDRLDGTPAAKLEIHTTGFVYFDDSGKVRIA